MRLFGTFMITITMVVMVIAGLAWPKFGMAIIAGVAFLGLWGIIDSILGHHFERNKE